MKIIKLVTFFFLIRCVPYFGNVIPLAYEHDAVSNKI